MTALPYLWLWVRTRPAVRLAVRRAVAAIRRTAARQLADAREVARLTVDLPPARGDLSDSPWRSDCPNLHWVGRPIATHRSEETATNPEYIARHHVLGMAVLVRVLLAPTQEFAGILATSYTTEEREALIDIGRPEMVRAT